MARVATPHQPHHEQYGSFASNSPITDGKHVIAFFGSRGLYCYTLDGTLVWEKDFGQLQMYNDFGEGAWTALDGNSCSSSLDHEGESFLIALDKTTGRELWRTPRQGNTNWSGPYVTTHNGRKQVIVSASREVVSYDLETGKVIWSARGLGQNTIPRRSPRTVVVFVMSGFRNPNLMAIRLGREGDLTGTDAILWQNQRGNSYTPRRCCTTASCTSSPTRACCPASMRRRASRTTSRCACRSPTTSRRRPWAPTASCTSPRKRTT